MSGEKLRILVVDDEEKFLDSMVERMRLKGYEPFAARSGHQALEAAKKHKVQVAVVDLRMPDMDGLETITRLKEIQPDIMTVLLTAFGDDKVKEATEALDSEYFDKREMGRFWAFIADFPRKKVNLLLVDDEDKFLNSIADRIRLKGFVPFTAHSGHQALKVAEKHKIQLAVVDLRMPDMDGLETINKLKELQPEMKTVLLTAFGDEKVKEATQALDSEYFEKHEMGAFWSFMRKVLHGLETSMAAVGMASGGDQEGARQITRDDEKKQK